MDVLNTYKRNCYPATSFDESKVIENFIAENFGK